MTFDEKLVLTIVDKGLLAAFLAVFGLWLNARLEKYRSQLSFKQEFAKKQVEAAGQVWGATNRVEAAYLKLLSKTVDLFYREYNAAGARFLQPEPPRTIEAALNILGAAKLPVLDGDAEGRIIRETESAKATVLTSVNEVAELLSSCSFWLGGELHRKLQKYFDDIVTMYNELGKSLEEPGTSLESVKEYWNRLEKLQSRQDALDYVKNWG